MNFIHEYALLAVVAIPVAILIGINLALWFAGERDTLLLPGSQSFPAGLVALEVEPTTVTVPTEPAANDDYERKAA